MGGCKGLRLLQAARYIRGKPWQSYVTVLQIMKYIMAEG